MPNDFQKLGDLFDKKPAKKPPAYQWQELALRLIKELNVPSYKRSSVFKICKDRPKMFVEQCLADTKELCESKEKWQYFFKVVSDR